MSTFEIAPLLMSNLKSLSLSSAEVFLSGMSLDCELDVRRTIKWENLFSKPRGERACGCREHEIGHTCSGEGYQYQSTCNLQL